MEQLPHTDVVKFPFQPIDAQKVIADFWEQNDEALRTAINNPAYIDGIYESLPKKYITLTKDQLAEELYKHEVAFVEHMLTRLCSVLNNAQEKYGFDNEGIAFNINTSLLYDVDETIGGRPRDHSTFRIRPAATLLFAYLRKTFSDVKLGIISTRENASLQRQLDDENAVGSLTQIKPYINGEVTGIYSIGGITNSVVNESAFDTRAYPDFQPPDDAMYVMKKMGVDADVATDVINNQLPLLLADAHEYELLEFPNLWVDTSEKLSDFIADNRDVFPGYKSWDMQNPVLNLLKFELCKRTRVIAEYFDSHGDENPTGFLDIHAREIAANPELGLSQEHQDLFVPTVTELLRQSYDVIVAIDDKVLKSERVIFPDGVTTKMAKLEFMADRAVSLYQTKGHVDVMRQFNYRSGNHSSDQLRRHVFNKGNSLLIESSEFAENFRNVSSAISYENQRHQVEFGELLGKMLGARHGFVHVSLLQRISACLRQLDDGIASVVIAVDDAQIAAKFDELFQGKFVYEGKIVDPIALFKMPESYRGRIFLMHVGAEYSQKAIHDRIEKVLAA